MTVRATAAHAHCAIFLVSLVQAPAFAKADVTLGSAVFVERTAESARVLEPASRLSRGDRVVTVLTWQRSGSGGQFTLTNPLPRSLYYQGSANDDEEVSVDGGRTWGKLGALKAEGRFATPEDVTHLRWRIDSPSNAGRIAYSAVVR
ncbi:MAG: hypothetical protein ABIU18_00400 [Novosphingobium sp.]